MRLMKAGRCHQHTFYKGLAKLALRMFNAFVPFYYGALYFSCYNGDSAPGGELPGLLLVKRTHGSYMDLAAGVTEGLGTGSVRPHFRARRFVPTGHAAR